ncbi:MAG: bifunctional UDP-sugar hydrolase/5'-nucleotidase [Verrucomicrobiota bacterium]
MNLITRRKFCGGALAALVGGARGAEGKTEEGLQVLHTTDLHGHVLPTVSYGGEENVGGFARCAQQIRNWRAESAESLLIDVGDVYQGTLASWQSRGQLMIDLFNKVGYDGWVLGNHEFDWGPEVVEEALKRSEMPALAANLRLDGKMVGAERTEGLFQKLRPWMLKEVGGEKVAVIGLITPGLPYWLRQELLGPIEVVDPEPVLKRCVKEVRAEGATKVVVAGHMGWRERGDDYASPVEETLAGSGVDLYLGGHTHRRKEMWDSRGIPCAQAAYHGLSCGRVKIGGGTLVSELAEMDASVDFDPLVMEVAGQRLEEAKVESERVVGLIPEIVAGQAQVRDFLCEAFLAAAEKAGMKVDAVFHGTFGTEAIEKGEFRVEDAWKVIPYENQMVVAELTLAEMSAIVREGGGARGSDRALFGDLEEHAQAVRPKKGVGEKERYRVLFNSYDAQSGGRRMPVLREILGLESSRSRLLALETREALIDYVASL